MNQSTSFCFFQKSLFPALLLFSLITPAQASGEEPIHFTSLEKCETLKKEFKNRKSTLICIKGNFRQRDGKTSSSEKLTEPREIIIDCLSSTPCNGTLEERGRRGSWKEPLVIWDFASLRIEKKDSGSYQLEYLSREARESGKELWRGYYLAASYSYLQPTGKTGKMLPAGYGTNFTLAKGLDDLSLVRKTTKGKRVFWVPGVAVDLSKFHFDHSPVKINGTGISVGPAWFFSLGPRKNGLITLSLLPGLTQLNIEDEKFSFQRKTWSAHSLLAYEKPLGPVSFSLQARVGYIHDTLTPFMTSGGGLGVSYGF